MFDKNTMFSGLISGVMLATVSFTTPASADQASFRLEVGLKQLLTEIFSEDETTLDAQNIDFNGVPIAKIHRKLRRRGLYPITEYRRRGDVVILRAEDDFGTVFRVVADADYGDILRVREVRATSNYRPRPVDPPFYDNGNGSYQPNYNNGYNQRNNAQARSRAEQKAAKSRAHAARKAAKSRAHAARKAAKSRAHAAQKAANSRAAAARRAADRAYGRPGVSRASQARAEAASRKAAKARAQASRKAAKARARASRKAAKARARASRKAAKSRADRNRRASSGATALPYVGLSPEEYKKQQYGGGK